MPVVRNWQAQMSKCHLSTCDLREAQIQFTLVMQVKLKGSDGEEQSLGATLKAAIEFMKLPTFGIVILQGVVGSTPWCGTTAAGALFPFSPCA